MIEHEVGPSEEAHEAPSGAEAIILDPDRRRRLSFLPGGVDTGTPSLYGEFIASSKKLEDKLQDFSQKVLKLGSGNGLSKSSIEVREGLEYMRKCFEMEERPLVRRKKHEQKLPVPGGPQAQTQETNRTASLLRLSSSLSAFSDALTDYDDYSETKTFSAIRSFRTEVLTLSEALAYFSSGPEDADMATELNNFIKGRLSTANAQFDNAIKALLRFVDTGIPCIESAQERSSRMMLNASTVATFFAGVAATTLQYTSIDIGTTIRRVIQTLWFSSLVLSIGSAVTSLLVFAWRQAVFSRTQRKLPAHIRFWSRSGYLVLLSASIIAFISGLVTYVYALQRTRAMFWVVTACTAFCAISLADVLRCFATDQWIFWKTRKTRSLVRILSPEKQSRAIWKRLKNIWPLLRSLRHFRGWRMTSSVRTRLWRSIKNFFCSCYTRRDKINSSDPDMERGAPGPIMPWGSANNVNCSTESLRFLSSQGIPRTMFDQILDMQFSPNGEWLAVCTTFRCYVKCVNSEIAENYEVLSYFVQQVKWSPNGERLLTRTRYYIEIWSFKKSLTFKFNNYIEPGKSLVDVEWIDNSMFIALSNDADSMFTVRLSSMQQELMEIRLLPSGLTIYEMTTMTDPQYILLLATRNVKDVPKEKGISCIIVYDMVNYAPQESKSWWRSWWLSRSAQQFDQRGRIISKVPLLKKAKGISVSSGASKTRLVVTYEESLPEVWSISENGTISKRCELRVPKVQSQGKVVWGSASFVGYGENFIACAENGVVHFWKDTTGDFGFQHLRSLPIHYEGGSDVGEDEYNSSSDGGSGDGFDVDGKMEEAVFAWSFRSGVPTMASGYLGVLQVWSPPKSTRRNTYPGVSDKPSPGQYKNAQAAKSSDF